MSSRASQIISACYGKGDSSRNSPATSYRRSSPDIASRCRLTGRCRTNFTQPVSARTHGREAQWTLIGKRRDLIDRLTLAGAFVHEVRPLGLEESALAFLSQEVSE